MVLPDWKDLNPEQKTTRGLYELIKSEIEGKNPPKEADASKTEPEPVTPAPAGDAQGAITQG